MMPFAKPKTPPKVAIVAVNRFSPFHLSVPCMIFADEMLKQPLFELSLVAAEEGVISSSIGMTLTGLAPLATLAQADIIIVPYWRSPSELPNPALLEALASAYRRGALVIGLCLGTYVLAYSGILSGKTAATHWEAEADFLQRFTDIQLDTNALYIEDERVITSAGTAAGIDCCLYVFSKYYGNQLANKVARRMVVPAHRDGGQAQFIERPIPEKSADSKINQLLGRLRHDLSRHYRLDELADSVAMTRRTFTRKFSQATGMSVGDWLKAQRLQESQALLESTRLSVEQIAEQTGFSSVIAFREQFKQRFSVTPGQWRRSFHQQSSP